MALAVVALGACKDMGARGSANVPLSVARTRPVQFWAYQAVQPATRKAYEGRTGDQVTLGGQSFIVQFPSYAGPQTLLKPAGGGADGSVFALAWAQPPFDQVVVGGGGRLQTAAEIWR
jgi:hypothetical protein